MTAAGVRTRGAWLNTAATVAIFFLLAFMPLARLGTRSAPSGFTIGMPLQSMAPTRTSSGPSGAAERVE